MSTSIFQFLIYSMLSFYISGALLALILYRKHKLSNILSNSCSIIASILGVIASTGYLLSNAEPITLLNWLSPAPFISLNVAIDSLSAFFILTLSILTFCVSIYSTGYLSHYYNKRAVGLFNFLYNLFILSMIAVITSGNMVFFLIAWEVMSLTSYFLVIFEGEVEENQKAGTFYLIMTHVATAFLTIAFVLIYKFTGSLELGASLQAAPAFIKNILFICFLIGFGTKAGIIPLHVWLPYAHPAAPSNVSALMSGVMIKTAIYGLIRFVLGSLGAEFQWWGTAILVVGVVSTVLGVAYALMEHNIKRLLAYHSIENIGIILIGLGIALIARSDGNPVLFSLAMLAALFHLLNHTIFKGALFLGAGAVHYATHTKDLEELGGLLKKMPYTGLFFLIASLSISAIPPFNGFVSEWLTYQALFLNFGTPVTGLKLLTMLGVAGLAMAGAMAAACFVKSFGISFLGLPRSEEAKEAREVSKPMLWGMGLLSALCLTLGVLPFLAVKLLDKVNLSLAGVSMMEKFQGSSFFIYYPLTIGKNSISPLTVGIAGLLLIGLVLVVVRLIGRGVKERKYGTWDCGFKGLNARMQYSATGFSKPLRIVLRGIYRPARELQIVEGPSHYHHKSMKYVVSTEPVFEKYLYRPVTEAFTRFAGKARILIQTGSVHMYLIYLFITLIALLVYYDLF
jgi:hydrogenase-4 component B